MSSTQVTPSQTAQPPAQSQPTQQHVDTVANALNQTAATLQTQQQRNNVDTAEENARRAQASENNERTKQGQITRNAQAQRSINQARQESIQTGDHVVVELDKPTPEQMTAGLQNSARTLHTVGAHHTSGRVTNIEMRPIGRVFTIEAAQATLQVPEQFVTRADLFDND